MSELEKALEKFRLELLIKERAAASVMVRVYGVAWQRIKDTLERLDAEYQAMKALEQKPSAEWIYQYNRQRAFRAQVENELRQFAQYAEQSVHDQMSEAIIAAERHAERLVIAALRRLPPGVTVPWNRISTAAVAEIVGLTQPDSPLHALIFSISSEGARAAEDALIQGLLAGKNPRETARFVRKALGITLTRALRIARTETLRAYREATRISYQANRDIIDGWQWCAKLDHRTCAMCWMMHGTIHTLNERLDDHPNGRCAMSPVVKSWAEIGKVLGIDLADVQESRTMLEPGVDVFTKLDDAEQIKILGKAKWTAWKSGKFELPDLIGRKHSRIWGSMRYERSLSELEE